MTTLMQKALEAVRSWPKHRQDEAAELLLALEQVARGEQAIVATVEDAFARFRK